MLRKLSLAPTLVRSLALGAAVLTLPVVARAQGDAAQTHTVKPGDTLWSLAQRYLNDPLLWPEIYRLNTDVVEDPHWIYPGEVLRLVSGGNVTAVPTTDTPAPVAAAQAPAAAAGADTLAPSEAAAAGEAPTADGVLNEPVADANQSPILTLSRTPDERVREAFKLYLEQPYRPLRRSEFYSSGFLTEDQDLPFGRVLGPVVPPQIQSITRPPTAMLYADIGIEAPKGATYQVGDSVLLVMLGAEVKNLGRVVIPTGLARIKGTQDGRYVGTVIAIYDAIRPRHLVLPLEHFKDGGTSKAAPVSNGVTGQIVGWPGREELKATQNVIFIDKGRRDGVAAGDLFEVRSPTGTRPDGTIRVEQEVGLVQIVHVRDRSATGRLVTVRLPDMPTGTKVQQVGKLPS